MLTSFSEAARLVDRFERILRSHGIEIVTGSDLESVCLDILELEYFRLGESQLDPMTDIRPLLGQAAGWIDFLKLLIRGHNENRLADFVPHLQLLNTAREVTQNTRLPVSDEASNKIFELFVALTFGPIGTNLLLDDPQNARGDNPDVLVDIQGRRWGFACKVINGTSPLTLFERFAEGIEQIERSPAETGFVFFNFKNLIDHRLAWPITNEDEFAREEAEPEFGAWMDETPVLRQFSELINDCLQDFVDSNGLENVLQLIDGRPSMPGAAVYMATASAIQSSTGPLPTLIGQVGIMRIREFPAHGENVLKLFNQVLHGQI